MKIYRNVVVFLLALLILITPTLTVGATVDYDIGSKIEQYVQQNINTTAGMSVAVFNDKHTIYRNSFGYSDVQNKIPVADDTVMEWGSVSKLLVWVSAMQLSEQGKLDLNADINKYLPKDFLHNRKFDKPVTMLNLMNHNAGFEDSVIGMSTGKEEKIVSVEEYLSEIQPAQVFEPGTVCAYSNWSTTLAAYIIECISGVPYSEYVRKNIFEPLDMNDTAICADLSDNPSVKERRSNLKLYSPNMHEITPNMAYIIMYPAGMCTSTITDMQAFAQSILSEDTVLFKKKDTYKTMISPSLYYGETKNPQSYHGFWSIDSYGTKLMGHGGNTAGCSSNLLLDMENKTGMVIQTNQYAEQIYTQKMPELFYGKYQGNAAGYTGLVMSGRTIFKGPLKLYRLLSVYNKDSSEGVTAYSVRTNQNGIDKISSVYGDSLVIEFKDIALDVIVIGLYILALLYCAVNLVRGLVMAIINKTKGRSVKKPFSLWCLGASVLQFVPVIIFILVIPTLFNFQQLTVSEYRFVFFLVFLVAVALLALVVYSFIKIRKCDLQKSRKIYIYSMNASLIVSLINIIYWNWCMFWMI
ncbi:MAG: serine hydrolase domain-containing protein [Acutalibacteraceae bacterium]|nr:serine hydrolase domain-containing protein [Acutalibacteraceae bacterium]